MFNIYDSQTGRLRHSAVTLNTPHTTGKSGHYLGLSEGEKSSQNQHNYLLVWTFTFMHLADAFIQSDLQCNQAIHSFVSMCVPWELNPRPFALLTQWHIQYVKKNKSLILLDDQYFTDISCIPTSFCVAEQCLKSQSVYISLWWRVWDHHG